MAKPNPYAEKMFKMFPKKEIDENAFTVKEISDATGTSASHTANKIRKQLLAGEVEQVWKKTGGRLVPAYRPKRK